MLQIFCDFDGTITTTDVGYELFRTYAGEGVEETVQRWLRNEIDSSELLKKNCEAARISEMEFNRFVDAQSIEPEFLPFYDWCKTNHVPVIILSDGLDAYIRRLLANSPFSAIPFYANTLHFHPPNRLTVSFPYYAHTCGMCANCKGWHLRQQANPDATTIFVGNGYSDRCAIPYADVLFAKQSLQEYCQREQIPCRPYSNFADVLTAVQTEFSVGGPVDTHRAI